MTQTTDPAQAFTEALDDDVRARLRITKTVQYLVQVSIEQCGWTIEQLAYECSRDLDDVTNVGAVVTERLRITSTVAPPKAKAGPKRALPHLAIVHDGCCDNGWIYNEESDPPTQTKCLGANP